MDAWFAVQCSTIRIQNKCLNGLLKILLCIHDVLEKNNSPLVVLITSNYDFMLHTAIYGKIPAEAAGIPMAGTKCYKLQRKSCSRLKDAFHKYTRGSVARR